MILHPRSRFVVIAVMLLLQSLIFLWELPIVSKRVRRELNKHEHQKRRYYYLLFRQLLGPASIALLGIILIPITFSHASRYIDDDKTHCSANIDGDIAGDGTRIAIWAQVGVLLVISILGSFHTSATGAKESGAGLVLTHLSLSIAILVQMMLGTLTSANAVIGAMILDAQNIGLSISLTAKDTLAARWLVRIVVPAQIFGFLVIYLLIANFTRGVFASDDCSCLTVFWWAWLSNCGSSTYIAREMPIFWTYYACRSVGLCQTSFHSLYNSSRFDAAEKSERPVKHDPDEERGTATIDEHPSRYIRLKNATYIYISQDGEAACFKEYPATVTIMYAVNGVFSLASLSTVQTTIADFNLGPSSPIDSVGQIIALTVAAATLIRATWLCYNLFRGEAQEGNWNFVWPFKWEIAKKSILVQPTWLACYSFGHHPDCLSLGAILRKASDPTSQIAANCDIRAQEVKTTIWRIGRFCSLIQSLFGKIVADEITTSTFSPSQSWVKEKLEEIMKIPGERKTRTLYLVTGLKVAKGFRAPRPAYPEKAVTSPGSGPARKSRSDILYAYSLRKVSLHRSTNQVKKDRWLD